MPDGRVRLYFVCNKGRGASAISNDGLNFRLEDGFRLERVVDPNVLCLSDGTYWIFYASSPAGQRLVQPQQIYTARSTDGLNWTVESLQRTRGKTEEGYQLAGKARGGVRIEINSIGDKS